MIVRKSPDYDAFESRINSLVLAGLQNAPCFQELIAGLPGVYPTATLEAAERLAYSGRISREILASLRRDAASYSVGVYTRSILLCRIHSISNGASPLTARGPFSIWRAILLRHPGPFCSSAHQALRSKPSHSRSTSTTVPRRRQCSDTSIDRGKYRSRHAA